MQDGAPAHTSRVAMDWLKCRFGDKLISNKSDFTWPPGSPDLNPLDFYFWGDMKQKIHEGSLRSLMDAKNLIGHFLRRTVEDKICSSASLHNFAIELNVAFRLTVDCLNKISVVQ